MACCSKSNTRSLGASAYMVKAHLPCSLEHHRAMDEMSKILAENLKTLMEHYGLGENSNAVKARAKSKGIKLDQKTVWRFQNELQSPTIFKLNALAKTFGIEAWQLLIPGLQIEDLPSKDQLGVIHGEKSVFTTPEERDIEEIIKMLDSTNSEGRARLIAAMRNEFRHLPDPKQTSAAS